MTSNPITILHSTTDMPTPQIPQTDPFPQVQSGKYPPKVKDILRQHGVDVSAQERAFEEAIKRGGVDKENAVRSAYEYFDEIQGTSQFKTALQSYEAERERSVSTRPRNESANSGLAAPRARTGGVIGGVIGGEDIGIEGPVFNVDPESGLPAAQQPAAQPSAAPSAAPAAAPAPTPSPGKKANTADPNMGLIEIGARATWNSVVEKGKGFAQMLLSGEFLRNQKDQDDLFDELSESAEGQELVNVIKDMNGNVPTRHSGKYLKEKEKREKADQDFKNRSIATTRWFDENAKLDIPENAQKAPFSYDREAGAINWDNFGDSRAWVNTIASSAGSSLIDMGIAAGAAAATRGKSPKTIAATKNAVRAFSFISSTAQMFPGYVQEGLDNGLSYGDAIKVAGPLSVVNGAIELVGLEFVMKGVGLGKPQAQAVVRDVLNKSASAAIKQLVKKEITADVFMDTVKRSAMAAFKNIGNKQTAEAAKLFFQKTGSKVGTIIGQGVVPESLEEVAQGGMEFAAKELYNKAVAAKGSRPGEGKFDNNRGEALANTMLGAIAGGIVGGGMAMAYANPKLYDQTMFSYANTDVRHQLGQGAGSLADIKENGKIFQKIEQWRQQGQFNVPQNGTTVFDQQAYDQAVDNANMMYETAWEFRNFKDFDDMTRLDMFNIAKTRKGIRDTGNEIQTARAQIDQIDQWISDPESVPEDEYGDRPSQIMLENQKAEIQKSLGKLDPGTGMYESEARFQDLSGQIENIIKQGIPRINDTETRRDGRAFIASGLNAVQANQDPNSDDFVADWESTLPDGTVVVMNEAGPDVNAYARRLVAEPIAGTVMDQLDSDNYKPVDRMNWRTAPIENFDHFQQAIASTPERIKKDTTRKYNVGDDANEILSSASNLVIQASQNPATAGTLDDQVEKMFNLYAKVASHRDAIDDGVREMTREQFNQAVGIQAAETAAPEESAQGSAPAASAATASASNVRSLLNTPVMFEGRRADLFLDGKTVLASPIGTNQEFEVGNIDEIGDLPSDQFQIAPETNIAQVNDDGTVTVRDKVYQNKYSNPLSAINRKKDGEVTSVTLDEVTEGGKTKKRTFRGQAAQDIAYELILKENSKDSGTEQQFNDFVEQNQFVRDEIVAGEATVAAESATKQAPDAVSGSQTENTGGDANNRERITFDNIRPGDQVLWQGVGEGTPSNWTFLKNHTFKDGQTGLILQNPDGTTVVVNEEDFSKITQPDITQQANEVPQQPGSDVNTPESPTLQSEYIAARELSQLTSDIEQRQESLRSAVESANQVAEQVQDSETVNEDLSGLVRAIESVVAEAGRVDNQIETAIGQIVNEVEPESIDSDNSEEGAASPEPASTTKPESVAAPLNVVNTPVSEINTDTDRFQNREAEFSESSVQSIIKAVETGKFNPGKFDPVRLWSDPVDKKTYVLAGHSRREAFRRLSESGNANFNEIPSVFLNDLTEQEAINYALNESNTLATQETDLEGAAAWRRMREGGKRDSQIRTDIGNRSNKARLELLSYLNPTGQVMNLLKSIQGASASNATRLNQVGEFIGEANKIFGDQLTPSHENEMFEYLTEGAGKKITKRSEFIDRLNNVVSNFSFDPKQPLNLANRATKGTAQVEAENYYKELLAQKDVLEQLRRTTTTKEGIEEYDQRIRNLNKKIVDANRAMAEARAADRQQTSLFKFNDPRENNPIFQLINTIAKSFPNIQLNIPTTERAYLNNMNAGGGFREIYRPGNNTPIGYVSTVDSSVNLNPARLSANLAIHEYGHVWMAWAKNNRPDLYKKGIDLVKASPYTTRIEKSPEYQEVYKGFGKEIIYEEALVTAIGDKGESFVLESRKASFKNWLNNLFGLVKKHFGIRNMTAEQVQDLDFESFVNGVVNDLLSGESVSEISSLNASDILNQAGFSPDPEGNEISEEEMQENYDRTGQILFSFRTPTVWGTRPGETVGTAADYKSSAEAALPKDLATKRQSEFTPADKREIARIHAETGWEFKGFNEKTKKQTWDNDISKATNSELKTNEFMFTDDGRIVRMEMKGPAGKTRGAIAQTVINGTKLMLDNDSPAGRFMNFFAKRLRLANVETVVSLIDDDKGLLTQLIKNVKREGTARRSLARVYMNDTFTKYEKAMAPFTTFNGSNQSSVKKIRMNGVIQGADGKLKIKEIYVPVGYAMSLARTELSQRAMGAEYLTQTDASGIEETHSSLVLDDRHFIGSSLANPDDTSVLYGKDGVHKGAHFLINEVEEMDVTGKLVPFKDSFGKDADAVRVVFSNAEMNRVIGRFQRGIGAEAGEKEAFDIGTELFNKKEVTDMLAEENDKYMNPSEPFKRVAFYSPLNVMTQVRADNKVNSFSPSLEDSRRLHERKTRPDALGIQDDLRTAQYYMDGVSNILGYGRLVHNLKNVRDAIQREVVDLPNGKQIIGYFDEYIENLQNFQQSKAKQLSNSMFVRFVNFIMNKNTAFIFRGGIGISLTQSSTWASAFGQGHIKDTYLRKALPYLVGYSTGALIDSATGAGSSVNQETGAGKRSVLGNRTAEADAIDYITGANITDPAKKAKHLQRFATIIDRTLYGNNKFIAGVDFLTDAEVHRAISPGKVGSYVGRVTSQGLRKMDNFFEEYFMAPIRRTDRAVILTFIRAAQMQAKDEGLAGDALDARVAQITENMMYATNQMNDLSDTSGLQRSAEGLTKMVTMYTGQGQKLFNNLMQAFVEWHKYGKKGSTPEVVKNQMKKRIRGALASNLVFVPIWIAASRIGWGIVKSLLKGDELKEPKDYRNMAFFEYLRSVGSIVPGWTEQVSSTVISLVDMEKWEQQLFDIPGLDIVEGGLESTINLGMHMIGAKEGNEDKLIEQFTYNMTKLGGMLAGIPKVIVDTVYSRFIDEDKKKVSKSSKTANDSEEEELDDELEEAVSI